MRALGLGTKILAACGAALGLIAALGLPWHGPIPDRAAEYNTGDVSGPLDGVFAAIPRWLTEPAGTTGWELAGAWDAALAGCAALAAVAAVLCLSPAAEHGARALLQVVVIACLGIVLLKLAVRPAGVEPRFGVFVALALAGALVVTAQGIAAAKLRRKPLPPKRYAGARLPTPYEQASSVAPPGR